MVADVTPLYSSPLLHVLNFECREAPHSLSRPEYAERYSMCLPRTGHFTYRLNRKDYDIHSGVILLENAGSYHTARHGDIVRDQCTILQMNREGLEEFRDLYWTREWKPTSNSSPSGEAVFDRPAIRTTPWIDYLHMRVCAALLRRQTPAADTLAVETVLVELLSQVFRAMYDRTDSIPRVDLPVTSRAAHQETVEKAKEFIASHFHHPLQLSEISRHVAVSEFHFLRLFKGITRETPYSYLMQVRLGYALLLLRSTSCSVFDACFNSGFNNYTHFITSFRKQFGLSPLKARSVCTSKLDMPASTHT